MYILNISCQNKYLHVHMSNLFSKVMSTVLSAHPDQLQNVQAVPGT